MAAYLGVSSSQLCMSNSSKYMNRQLGPAQSLKMAELMQAHVLSQSGASPSLKKLQKQEGKDCACLAENMKVDARYHLGRVPVLQRRLTQMKTKVAKDTAWLNTLDHLIAKLPPATVPKSPDRIWLENHKVLVLERLLKNGPVAQMKLEVQIELGKAKARVYDETCLKHEKK